jgi:hypothetical protein
VSFAIPETQSHEWAGGACKSGCYDFHGKVVYLSDRWADYVVPWDRLEQQGWGTQARFDPARIVSLSFTARAKDLPIDFWLDDLAFVTAPEANALIAADRAQPPQPAPSARR